MILRVFARRMWFIALILLATNSYYTFINSPGSAATGSRVYTGMICTVLPIAFLLLGLPYVQTMSALKNPTLRGPLEYTFSAEGISLAGNYASSRTDWVLVKEVTESGPGIFVQMQPNHFHIIPKSQVSAADLATLKSILRACVKGKVKLKP